MPVVQGHRQNRPEDRPIMTQHGNDRADETAPARPAHRPRHAGVEIAGSDLPPRVGVVVVPDRWYGAADGPGPHPGADQ